MAKTCVIVIPVHKPDPTQYELISFEQCFRVLSSHPIVVLAPTGLDLKEYKKAVPDFNVKLINPKWMSSLLNYNKLKLSNFFYTLFNEYDYLLTYELDAFIFRDDLDHWCEQHLDYIGAPWFNRWDVPGAKPGDNLVAVGNSGFSIRKISAMLKGIKTVYYQDPTQVFKQSKYKVVRGLKKLVVLALNYLGRENITLQTAHLLNEDWVITQLIAKNNKNFRMATISQALRFSFEVKPEVLYQMNNNTLPMGCHAWWRYNLSFWKERIEQFGYKLA